MSTSSIPTDTVTTAALDPSGAAQPPPAMPPPPGDTPGPEPQDDLPRIVIRMKRLPEAVAAAQDALIAHNTPPLLFDHEGDPVKLVLAQPSVARLVPMKAADLQAELAFAARWFEQTDKGIKPIFPPALVVHALLQRLTCWAPPLREVVGVPVFGHDWQLLDQPGYHASDQVFYHPDHPPLEPVPDDPGEEEVAQARELLCRDLLGDFPFVSPSDRAAALAAMILPFVRRGIDGATPLHLFESPAPGTGKGLLADVVSIPFLGRPPAASTEIANADDLRKSITAMALAGEQIVLIDNVNARLKGAALASALTTDRWTDRIIGTSRMATSPMRCLWLATANNIAVTSELARRVVRSRIDAGVQQPHLRSNFRHPDLRAWARANRARLIRAILILVHHWQASGRPEGRIVLGSYESYCRVMGGILAAAGIEGFLANIRADQRHADDETAEWEAFIRAWGEHFRQRRVVSEELDKAILAPNPEMLSTTLAGTSSPRGRRIKLGQELRKRRDAILGGWRIKVSDGVDRHGCWHYRLEAVSCQHAS